MTKSNPGKFLPVLLIALLTGLLSILHVIIGFINTPAGAIYMWTGHYYLDYFQYVQSFAQGMQGKWLLENPLTLENTPRTFIGMWQNLILGKIGAILSLSPIATYWIFTFLFLVLFGIMIFKLIEKILKGESFAKQISAFILVLLAAPFYYFNSAKSLEYYSFWSDKSTLWKRFDSIPYHITANILAVVILLWFIKITEKISTEPPFKLILNALGISALISFVLTFSPSTAILLVTTIGIYNLIFFLRNLILKQPEMLMKVFIFTLVVLMIIIPAAVLIRFSLDNSYYKIAFDFEKNWQPQVDFKLFFLVHGPTSILAFLGLKKYFKEIDPAKGVFLTFVLVSYLIFFSPVALKLSTTNTRFLTPLSYVLFAVLSVIWIRSTKKAVILSFIILLFLIPVNVKAFQNILNDRNIFSPITYLPKGIIEGFKFLETRKEKGNVLMTPSQFLGTVLPIYADRKVYVARHNITLNYMEKNITASNFYLHAMSDEQALDLLRKNDLKFVVFTSIEGYDINQLYRYPFLEEIYKNKDIVIFILK